MEVTFRHGVGAPVALHRIKQGGANSDPNYAAEKSDDKHAVYYAGSSIPTTSGKSLRFTRTNWKPTASDDIDLYFDMHPLKAPQ